MSIQAMAWVLEESRAEGSDRLVLLAIANHLDAHGYNAWPKIDQIAKEARVSRSTVFRCLDSLATLGELEVLSGRGRGKPNVYRLLMGKVSSCDPLPGVEKVSTADEKGLTDPEKRSQSAEKRSQSCDTEPSLEPSKAEPSFARTCAREAEAHAVDEPTPPPTTWILPPLTERDREIGKSRIREIRNRGRVDG